MIEYRMDIPALNPLWFPVFNNLNDVAYFMKSESKAILVPEFIPFRADSAIVNDQMKKKKENFKTPIIFV